MQFDPFFYMWRSVSAGFYYKEGKLEEALEENRKALELNPYNIGGYWTYFDIYVKQDEDLKAIETLEKIMLMDTLTVKNATLVKGIYNKSGMDGLFNWLIELVLKNANPNPMNLAEWYAILDKKDESLDWLEKAYKEHRPNIPRINNNPRFDNLRTEPRFQAIIKKMGLSEYQIPK